MIFPKNNHFKVTMIFNFVIGIWPFAFANHPFLRTLYSIYSKMIKTIFATFVVCAYVEMAILGGETKTEELIGNLCVTLLCSMILLKTFVITNPRMVNLIREAMETEENIYSGEDEEVIEEYNLCVSLTNRTSLLYIVNCSLISTCHFSFPLLTATKVYDEATNQTITTGDLPVSAWMPWESRGHYWISYVWLVFSGAVISASTISFTDAFMFSLIIFPSGQMNILMHNLRNFKRYALEAQSRLGCSPEDASFEVMRQYILKHKNVIRYVDIYNEEMRYVTVFDFLVSSVQLATLTIQLVKSQLGFLDLIHWGGFVGCMLLRLLVYYWHANEIMLKSSNLGTAIWESDWFKEPYKIKQLMLIMITRSQRPLSLDIGPFTTMTLERFLGIVKAAYSYVMIMYR